MRIKIEEITTDKKSLEKLINENIELLGWKIISIQKTHKHTFSKEPTWILTIQILDSDQWVHANGQIENIKEGK